MEPNQTQNLEQKPKSEAGPIIGSIIIIIILIIGGFYYWSYLMNKNPEQNTEPQITNEITDPEIKEISEQLNNDDELNAIDSELQEIENEINSALE